MRTSAGLDLVLARSSGPRQLCHNGPAVHTEPSSSTLRGRDLAVYEDDRRIEVARTISSQPYSMAILRARYRSNKTKTVEISTANQL
ncbi:hypothetical protein SAMD00023353_1001570 [Rosellinia necatrix]|uniref:Uncharacterized protein n=1 Tax=Rosellinia necatrix TaxID=77044 RepID=A0A1S8A6M7_ROSNE|nr:hypothetical protein SAMD00023353_1001570 [Rosellinia necatrix]